jgi:hypothetical protein
MPAYEYRAKVRVRFVGTDDTTKRAVKGSVEAGSQAEARELLLDEINRAAQAWEFPKGTLPLDTVDLLQVQDLRT